MRVKGGAVLKGFQEGNVEGSFGAGAPNRADRFFVQSEDPQPEVSPHALSTLQDRTLDTLC